MANTLRIKRRSSSGSVGAPASLLNAELAFNEADNKLYIGYGDNGSGVATSIATIGGSGGFIALAGNQSASGTKTFSGTLNASGTLQIDGSAVTATAAEINKVGDLGTFTGSTISDNATLVAALQELETAAESMTGGNGDLRTLTGTSSGDTDLGTFTGSTIADSSTIKAALQSLETALEDGTGSLSGDSGSASFSGGSVTVAGGTGLTSSATSSTLTINLDDTAVSAGSYGSGANVPTYTVDAQGRLTAASNTAIDIVHTQVSDFDAGVQANTLDSLAAPAANVALNSKRITGLADPVNDQDAVTKVYADALTSGLDVKESVRVATTGAITLSGTQTIDGVSLSADDRVLVKNQGDSSDNGIYDVGSSAWSRSSDADNSPAGEVTSGMFAFVEEGTVNADSGYILTTNGAITLGSTALTFAQFTGAGQISAGDGLTKTGNVLAVVTADSARIVTNANSIDLATIGSAGTYNGLTVDAYGRATAFSSPTTLAGYGIADGQPLDATLTALAGVSTSANQLIYSTGSDAFSTSTLSTFARSILDDADAAAARTTLGLGTIATQASSNVSITGGSIDNITIDAGTF